VFAVTVTRGAEREDIRLTVTVDALPSDAKCLAAIRQNEAIEDGRPYRERHRPQFHQYRAIGKGGGRLEFCCCWSLRSGRQEDLRSGPKVSRDRG
jgi:hypothetical protein